jgi:hypothetical protein
VSGGDCCACFLAEINYNEIVIKAIDESGTSLPESPHLDKLKTETWEERRQVASGLPEELLKDLVSYYQPLEIFGPFRASRLRTRTGRRQGIGLRDGLRVSIELSSRLGTP